MFQARMCYFSSNFYRTFLVYPFRINSRFRRNRYLHKYITYFPVYIFVLKIYKYSRTRKTIFHWKKADFFLYIMMLRNIVSWVMDFTNDYSEFNYHSWRGSKHSCRFWMSWKMKLVVLKKCVYPVSYTHLDVYKRQP